MPTIKLGTVEPLDLDLGNLPVQKAYLGATEVWPPCDLPPYYCNTAVRTGCITDFTDAWYNCTSLTSFPSTIDVSLGTNFSGTWANCFSLAAFPSTLDFSSGTNFYATWGGCVSLTTFPTLNLSNGTNFLSCWNGCSNLTSFPNINVSNGTSFFAAWYSCSNLSSFPSLSFSNGLNFNYAWQNCTNLAIFPANLFDTCNCTNFLYAWYNCALNQTSVDNILVSIDTAGQSGGILYLNGGTSSAPSTTGLAAKTALQGRGWTVLTNAAPALTLSITSDKATLLAAETATITFTFSNAPTGFTSGDVAVSGGTLTGFTSTGNPLVYTATLNPTLGIDNGSATVSVSSGSYSDVYGNSGPSASSPAITYDTLPPSISITTPISTDGIVDDDDDELPLTISGTALGANGQTATINVGGTNYTSTVSANAWSITLSSAQIKALPQGTIGVTADVSDPAGNPATQATASFLYDNTISSYYSNLAPQTFSWEANILVDTSGS